MPEFYIDMSIPGKYSDFNYEFVDMKDHLFFFVFLLNYKGSSYLDYV